jgi:mannose-6-phosphate isomerase-like protein (cupin superfamily)
MEHVNETDLSFRTGSSGAKYLFRGPHIDWGVIVVAPGERLGTHYHERVEETFYFIAGQGGLMIINGVEHPIRIGDAFRLDPAERHDIFNNTAVPLRVVFIKSTYDPNDKIDVE